MYVCVKNDKKRRANIHDSLHEALTKHTEFWSAESFRS